MGHGLAVTDHPVAGIDSQPGIIVAASAWAARIAAWLRGASGQGNQADRRRADSLDGSGDAQGLDGWRQVRQLHGLRSTRNLCLWRNSCSVRRRSRFPQNADLWDQQQASPPPQSCFPMLSECLNPSVFLDSCGGATRLTRFLPRFASQLRSNYGNAYSLPFVASCRPPVWWLKTRGAGWIGGRRRSELSW